MLFLLVDQQRRRQPTALRARLDVYLSKNLELRHPDDRPGALSSTRRRKRLRAWLVTDEVGRAIAQLWFVERVWHLLTDNACADPVATYVLRYTDTAGSVSWAATGWEQHTQV